MSDVLLLLGHRLQSSNGLISIFAASTPPDT